MTAPELSKSTADGRHYVNPRNAKEVPSITNVTGMKDKPALKWWAAKEAAIFAANNLDTLSKLTVSERVDLIKGAPFRRTATASDHGNAVHDWIDRYVKTGEHPPKSELADAPHTQRNMYKQFASLVAKYKIKFLHSEFTVWSDKYDYAGTADWDAEMVLGGKRTLVLGDTKTGKGVYPEVGMQLGALAGADYIIDGEGNQRELPKYDRFAVLHVRPRGASLIPVKNVDRCFQAFLGLRVVFDWHVRYSKDQVLGYAPKHTATKEEAE